MNKDVITETIARKVLSTVDAGLSFGVGKPIPGEMCVEAAVCYAMGLPHGDEPTCVSSALRSLKITLNDANWSSKQARAKGMRRLALIQLGSKGVLNDEEFAKRVAEMTIRKTIPMIMRKIAKLPSLASHKMQLEMAASNCEELGTCGAASGAAWAARAASEAAWAASEAARAARAARAASGAARAASRAASGAARAASEAASGAARAASEAASRAARAASEAASEAAWAASEAASDEQLATFAENVVQILIDMNVPGKQWLYLTE